MITVSSGRTTTQALISAPWASAAPLANAAGKWKPTLSPPPIAADCLRKVLREEANLVVFVMGCSLRLHRLLGAAGRLRRGMDRLADTRVRAAAADVGHRVVDVFVGRVRVLPEQRGRGHHLPTLAVPALRHLVVDPRLLHRVQPALRREALERDDALARGGG